MRNLFFLLFCLSLLSCNEMMPKKSFICIYEFENSENIDDEEIERVIEVIKTRLKKIEAKDVLVSKKNRNQIEVKLKTNYAPLYISSIITNKGELSFLPAYKSEELFSFTHQANELLKKEMQEDVDPIFDIIAETSYQGTSILFYIKESDTTVFNSYIKRDDIRALLPVGKRKLKFLFGLKTEGGVIPVHAVRTDSYIITEENITYSNQSYGFNDRPVVDIEMDELSSMKWEKMTGEAYENRSQIAIVVNDIVYSAPGVTSGPIHGGRSQIAGNFTLEQAQDLAIILSSGQRIPKLKLVKTINIDN